MRQVNIHEAKTHLSQLIEEVARGDAVIIAKVGKPVARLVGIEAAPASRRAGLLRGKIRVADDFDAPSLMTCLRPLKEAGDAVTPGYTRTHLVVDR